jgi:hypothetical protein
MIRPVKGYAHTNRCVFDSRCFLLKTDIVVYFYMFQNTVVVVKIFFVECSKYTRHCYTISCKSVPRKRTSKTNTPYTRMQNWSFEPQRVLQYYKTMTIHNCVIHLLHNWLYINVSMCVQTREYAKTFRIKIIK